MTAPDELRTARLRLRSFQHSDVPELVRLAGARPVAATTLRIPHPYRDADAEEFLQKCAAECRKGTGVVFAICEASSDALCGAVGLHIDRDHERAELGFWIGVPYWGQGYCTEAARAVLAYGFEVLKLHRIFAQHFRGNAASGRVLQKIGMQHEGIMRGHILKWGEFMDVEQYGSVAGEQVKSQLDIRSA
jgi:RimJ/RimL family protein N-acetyltransferase